MVKRSMLLLLAVMLSNQAIAMDMMVRDEMMANKEMSETETTDEMESRKGSCCKPKRFGSITVCGNTQTGTLSVSGNATIGGTLTVTGPVTASSFITTTGGVLFNGLRNYAVLSGQAALTSPATVSWIPTGLSSGISVAGGVVTLPTTGLFLVQYTVRVTLSETTAETSTATVQVLQGGVPVGQPAVTTNTGIIAVTDVGDSLQFQISGYAFINSAAAAGNTIGLLVNLTGEFTVPVATGSDANAQMVVLQLN